MSSQKEKQIPKQSKKNKEKDTLKTKELTKQLTKEVTNEVKDLANKETTKNSTQENTNEIKNSEITAPSTPLKELNIKSDNKTEEDKSDVAKKRGEDNKENKSIPTKKMLPQCEKTINDCLLNKPIISKSPSPIKEVKKTNRKIRKVIDLEKPDKKQSTLHQHFQVRRSERKTKAVCKKEEKKRIEEAILSGKEDGLEIRVIEGKGRGIFSKKTLKKGDLVCEYAGDLISLPEAKQREKEYEQNPELGCYMYYFEHSCKKYCIDATKESGRLGRLLNHSKTKNNVCTKLFPIGDTPHLILVAQRDIECDEELVYDYGERNKRAIISHPWLKS